MSQFFTKVLLAEDESVARDILSFYLNTIFDEVVVAKDGLEGLEIYQKATNKKAKFDLVLTDIKMPNMNGIEMLEKIYTINPNQKFIIVSAYKDEEKLLKSIDLKVLAYFSKPLNVDNVMKLLIKAKDEVIEEKQRDESSLKINSVYAYNQKTNLLYENNTLVKLSRKETQLLDILMKHRGKIIDLDTFKLQIWEDINTLDATFRTVMKRLKDKIKTEDFILSRKGQGYIIE